MKIYVTDSTGALRQIDGESVVIELDNGKTIEMANDAQPDRPDALAVWGGRQPQPWWGESERRLSEQLNVSLIAGNCMTVWPGRVKKSEQ